MSKYKKKKTRRRLRYIAPHNPVSSVADGPLILLFTSHKGHILLMSNAIKINPLCINVYRKSTAHYALF